MNSLTRSALCLLALLLLVSGAHAAELGVNYYHESMMTQQWGKPYIIRTISQAGQDFDDIKTISNNIKFYMNPFVTGNLAWNEQLAQLAKQKGMHTVVNMMTDDRQLSDGNWNDYANRVVAACQALNGEADEILVGNEIILHSSWSMYDVRPKVTDLIQRCDAVFGGQVSYEAFWFEKDAWIGYNGRLYFMQYESLDGFRTNVQEMNQKFGANAYIGEWGEDLLEGSVNMGDWWQKDQIEKRWAIIQQTRTPVAYLFTYREAKWDDFSMVRPDGVKRPMWQIFTGTLPAQSPTTCIATTEICDGKDNDCDGQTDENNVCASPAPQPESQLSSLAVTCNFNGAACSKASDATDSSCRYVTWNTAAGSIKVTACNKPGGIEIYRNAHPSGQFSACFGASCVDQNTGFVKHGTTTPPACVATAEVCDGKDNDCDGQSDENNICATPTPTASGINMAALARSCTANGAACGVQSDVTSGACRLLAFSTPGGDLRIQACDKGSGYVEMYRQSSPSGTYSACLANGCLNKDAGFVRFQPSGSAPPQACVATAEVCDGKDNDCDGQTDENNICASPAGVSGLASYSQPAGTKIGDYQESSGCRKLVYSTSAGWVEAKVCPKNGKYEMYLLSAPGSANICIGTSCVGSAGGFVVFG